MFVIKFIDGGTVKINQDEYQQILAGGDIIFLPRLGQTFKKSSFSRIMPEDDWLDEEQEKKKKQKWGILHDGTKVLRQFGIWVKEGNAYEDGNGIIRYDDVWWDYHYYPEIAIDNVKTPQEYQIWKNLLAQGKKVPYLQEGEKEIKRFQEQNNLLPIAEILKEKYDSY